MALKKSIAYLIRAAGLADLADRVRFNLKRIANRKENDAYKKAHSDITLPPDYFIYETYLLSYQDYINDGKETANEIAAIINKYSGLNVPGNRVLDWGCGPARVIRHFQFIADNKLTAFGTDYNGKYIKWNKENITGVTFTENELDPPLTFNDSYFAAIYGLSIVTHLSAERHVSWITEMHRLLQPNGLLIITSQGDAFINKLTAMEQQSFSKGNLIVRSKTKEGSRTFSAFQPEIFMRNLLAGFEILLFQKGSEGNTLHGSQDAWIVKKL